MANQWSHKPETLALYRSRWRCNAVLKELWQISHGYLEWDRLRNERMYVDIVVEPILGLEGISRHRVRLWNDDYRKLLGEQLTPQERRSLTAYLSRPRPSQIFYYRKTIGDMICKYSDPTMSRVAEKFFAIVLPVEGKL